MEADPSPILEKEHDAPALESLLDIAQGPIVRDAATGLQRCNRSLGDHREFGQLLLTEAEPNASSADLLFVNHFIEFRLQN
ncbi:hypothetical protein SAMN05428997_12924 [Bosea sp. CRIB-10]|nr:hypothetical protein SAMN05428997_12924 [Bosea sp. CRIB-10]